MAPGHLWLSAWTLELELFGCTLPLNLKVLSLPAVLLCVSYVGMGAALSRPEAGDLCAQLITATCPASLSLGLQESYLWLLSLSLPWGVSDPLVEEEKHRPAMAPAGSSLSPRLPSSNSDLALLQDPGTHCRNWMWWLNQLQVLPVS